MRVIRGDDAPDRRQPCAHISLPNFVKRRSYARLWALKSPSPDRIARDGWLARARALTPVLDKAAPRIEEAKALPPDIVDALHEAQLFRMLLPRSLGGAELALEEFFQVILAIAEG